MKSELKITGDGSATLYMNDLNEHYHSSYGAVQESMHVFIKAGLRALKKKAISIFEMGFGTGLNALLTYLEADKYSSIEFYALELFPLKWNLIETLNYQGYLNLTKEQTMVFRNMHSIPWEEKIQISSNFLLKKMKADMNNHAFHSKYDLFYFDAFAPKVQPELWTEEIFKKIFNAMNAHGILVTYSAKGEVRRDLQRAGFEVERLPGPPGKREIIRAIKQ